MKLLILTQKVDRNDDVLGFFHDWIREFSRHFEKITVICLYRGEYDLPGNVRVLSLGKEAGASRLKYLLNFYRYILAERWNYDSVFVHMNTEYVLLGGWLWHLMDKRIALWYAHGAVTWKVRAAEFFSHVVLSSSRAGFRMPSSKLVLTGQGIDTDLFRPIAGKKTYDTLRIISVGRIAPVKHYEQIIAAAVILRQKNIPFEVTVVGQPLIARDEDYFRSLRERVSRNNLESKIHFIGSVPFRKIAGMYGDYDMFINLSDTGSLDKAVLEAMSAGLTVLTANEAYKDIVPERYFLSHDPEEIAESIIRAANSEKISLREYVVENHGLKAFIAKIAKTLDTSLYE